MKIRSTLLFLLLALAGCSITPLAHDAAARDEAPYLVLISIDGFRHDYLDTVPTPALQHIVAAGIRAESLRPVWPTLTFPNHYSIATGLYPAEHGIIFNDFRNERRDAWYHYKDRTAVQDGRWYGGEPIWVAAERAGIGSAAFYFVGTEATIDGIAPSRWRAFDADVPGAARVNQALAWLRLPAAERPHLVTLYFEHVDTASHRYGPASAESRAAIRKVDGWIERLLDGIAALPFADKVTVAVVSDHGQSTYRDARPFVVSEVVSLAGVEVVEHGPVAQLYLPERDPQRARSIRDAINARWQHGRAWLPQDAPAAWHIANSPRMADIVLQAEPGYAVISEPGLEHKLTRGDHGWAPEFRDMHGIFIASGPGLPRGKVLATVDAVDVFAFLLQQLGLPDSRDATRPSPLTDPARDKRP